MKRSTTKATTKKICLAFLVLVLVVTAAVAGYHAGKNHVIYTQEMWVMDFEQPDPEHDITVYADIDGTWHEYGGYIG